MSKLGLIAGGGGAALCVAEAARSQGREVFVLALEGGAGKEMEVFPHYWMPFFRIKKGIERLKREGCRDLVFVGSFPRPDLSALPPLEEIEIPEGLLGFLSDQGSGRGDEALLSSLVRYMEEVEGFCLLGADEVCKALRAEEGLLAGSVSPEQEADVKLAAEAAGRLGGLDIGQAVVACRGRVLAVEAAEGTAAMLERVARLPERLRGSRERRSGVLVKLPRPGQDRRVDLPAVGVKSFEEAAGACLAGIAVEEGGALFVEGQESVAAEASRLGLFLLVMPRGS